MTGTWYKGFLAISDFISLTFDQQLSLRVMRESAFALFFFSCRCFSFVQINRLPEDLRQNAPMDGNVYIAPEYHQAPHHYIRVSHLAKTSQTDRRTTTVRRHGVSRLCICVMAEPSLDLRALNESYRLRCFLLFFGATAVSRLL